MNPEEFIRLYLPLGDGLYRSAFRLLGSQEEAEDAVQDLYIKLWNSRDSLDTVHNPSAWSHALLHNLCVDRLRSGYGERERTAPDVQMAAEEPPERSERLEMALQAVRSLSGRERNLLKQRLFYDLSYEEIARRTGMTEVALRVAFHRLKNKIKRKI